MKALLTLFLFLSLCFKAQNNARLYSANGEVFTVWYNNTAVNQLPEASVLLENMAADTLNIDVLFANQARQSLVIYLLDKGLKTAGKEYSYRLIAEKNVVRAVFAGISEVVVLPKPLVPVPATKAN